MTGTGVVVGKLGDWEPCLYVHVQCIHVDDKRNVSCARAFHAKVLCPTESVCTVTYLPAYDRFGGYAISSHPAHSLSHTATTSAHSGERGAAGRDEECATNDSVTVRQMGAVDGVGPEILPCDA